MAVCQGRRPLWLEADIEGGFDIEADIEGGFLRVLLRDLIWFYFVKKKKYALMFSVYLFRDKVNVVRNMDDDDDSDCKIWITQDKFSQNVANFLPDSLEIFKLEEIEPIGHQA